MNQSIGKILESNRLGKYTKYFEDLDIYFYDELQFLNNDNAMPIGLTKIERQRIKRVFGDLVSTLNLDVRTNGSGKLSRKAPQVKLIKAIPGNTNKKNNQIAVVQQQNRPNSVRGNGDANNSIEEDTSHLLFDYNSLPSIQETSEDEKEEAIIEEGALYSYHNRNILKERKINNKPRQVKAIRVTKRADVRSRRGSKVSPVHPKMNYPVDERKYHQRDQYLNVNASNNNNNVQLNEDGTAIKSKRCIVM